MLAEACDVMTTAWRAASIPALMSGSLFFIRHENANNIPTCCTVPRLVLHSMAAAMILALYISRAKSRPA